jgi:hypothetical protein
MAPNPNTGVYQCGCSEDCAAKEDTCNNYECDFATGECDVVPKVGAPCSDGDSCTVSDHCDEAGAGVGSENKDCSGYDDACNVGLCADGTCYSNPQSGSCDDGDNCTEGDYCISGQCVSGENKDCSAYDDCNVGLCADGACFSNPRSDSCDEDDSCNEGDYCIDGQCISGENKECRLFMLRWLEDH